MKAFLRRWTSYSHPALQGLSGAARWQERRRVGRQARRWGVAALLNRSARACWPGLVGWVQRDARDRRDRENTLRSAFSSGWCRRRTLCGGCYCGKFDGAGRLRADG